MVETLDTVDSVIKAVGGHSAAASLAGVGSSAVSNWRERGRIPKDHFFTFAAALGSRSKYLSRDVFGFKSEVRA